MRVLGDAWITDVDVLMIEGSRHPLPRLIYTPNFVPAAVKGQRVKTCVLTYSCNEQVV